MKLSKPVKILTGLLTVFIALYPFVIMPAFVVLFIILGGFPFESHAGPTPDTFNSIFPLMMVFYPLMMCYSFVQVGLQIFYIVHIVKNGRLTDTYRILFALGTFMVPYVAFPIYYFLYMLKNPIEENQVLEAA